MVYCTMCQMRGKILSVMEWWLALGWPLLTHTLGLFSVFPDTTGFIRRKLCFVERLLQRVKERLFYLLNASFVLICVSQAIKEPVKILALDLKCCQPQRCQHVCCQGSEQVWRLSARFCKSWEVQVTQVNVLWQYHRPVMSSLSAQPRQHGQRILI